MTPRDWNQTAAAFDALAVEADALGDPILAGQYRDEAVDCRLHAIGAALAEVGR